MKKRLDIFLYLFYYILVVEVNEIKEKKKNEIEKLCNDNEIDLC